MKNIENLVTETLTFMAQKVWTTKDQDFYESLSLFLAKKLKVSYVIIDLFIPEENVAKTLSFVAFNEVKTNVFYPLKNTPCDNVMGKNLCYYAKGIQKLFPLDYMLVDMKAESYIGIPLWDTKGAPIGLIALLDTKAIENATEIETILQIVAVRVAHEIERDNYENELIVAKEKAEKDRKLLDETGNMAKVGGWEFDIDTLELNWTKEIYRIHEVDFNYVPKVEEAINFYAPASKLIIENAIKRAVEFGEPWELELEIITAKNNLRSVKAIGKSDLKNRKVYGLFRDITEQIQTEKQLLLAKETTEKILQFQKLITNIQAKFLSTDSNNFDAAIIYAQRQICVFFGTDRSSIWQGSENNPQILHLTHLCTLDEISPVPEGITTNSTFPWFTAQLLKNQVVVVKDVLNMPKEAATDQENLIHFGDKSTLAIPFITGENPQIFGALTLTATSKNANWSENLISECQLIAQVFSSALHRKKQEHNLKIAIEFAEANEKELNRAQAITHIGNWHVNLIDGSLYLSDEIKRIYGYEPEEFLLSFEDAINAYHPEDRDLISNHYNKALETGEGYEFEMRMVQPNGNIRNVYSIGFTEKNVEGKVIKVYGVLQDITERKQAEEELIIAKEKAEASELKLKLIADNFVNGMLYQVELIDETNRKFNYISEAVTQLYGCTPEEAMQDPNLIYEKIHPDDIGELIEKEKVALKNMSIFKNEARVIMPDGSIRWAYYVSKPRMINGLACWDGIDIDITERKQMEFDLLKAKEKAEENQQTFRKLFEDSSDGILLLNKTGVFVECNQAALDLLKMKKENFLFLPPADISPKYQPDGQLSEEKAVKMIEIAYKKGLHRFDWTTLNSEGVEFIIEVSLMPIKVKGELMLHTTWRDVTERIRQEKELIVAKERAEESDRLKSAFLANMSHEIRTPMNGILGFSNLLKEPDLSGEEQQEFISIIEKSGARMLNIINDIIDISKIESGLMTLNIKESNINEQTEYIYTFFKSEIEAKGMKLLLKNSLPSKEAFIKTDREKVYAILINLVKNAIKYSNEGSIELGCIKKGKTFEFYVKDTGIGIPKDRQSAVFERFIQVDIEGKMAKQGAGLGLSITKSYVEMLGGKIWVESQEGIGSTFYFTLPRSVEPEGKNFTLQEEKVQINPNVLGLRILIAEDDKISKMLISRCVKEFSHEILTASTGNEAVEIFRTTPNIDLILMDIQMPGMNGYEATRQIRQFNTDVVIIAQTAFGLSGDRKKAIAAGCNDYISKPINKDELHLLIHKCFRDNI